MTDISNTEQLRRQTLDLLRFPLAIVVMLVHTWPDPLSIEPQFPLLKAICTIINAFIRNQSVPIYFFIAGYVFFYNVDFNKDTYIRKLKNRIKTLLIPYIIWNTTVLLITAIRLLVEITPIGQLLPLTSIEVNLSLKNILNCYWIYNGNIFGSKIVTSSPINLPLWFVRNLMIIVLSTPVIYQVIRRLKHYSIIILGIIWFIVSIVPKESAFTYNMLSGVFFFSFGAYMSICKRDMLVEFGRYFKSSMFIYPVLGMLYVVAAYTYPPLCLIIKSLNIFVGLLFAYNLSSWLLQKRYCKVSLFWSSSAFFIYVSHTLVIGYIASIQDYLISPYSDLKLIGRFLITSILTLCLLLGVFYLLRRYTPSFLRVITGRK